jgi:serine/threonine protein kinase
MSDMAASSEQKVHTVQSKRSNEKTLPIAPYVGSRFSSMSQIGSGTFGEVWKAFDNDLQSWVAVKSFQEVCSDHLGINMMVIREISLLRKLNHPNITKTLDVLIGQRINSESLLLVMVKSDSLI